MSSSPDTSSSPESRTEFLVSKADEFALSLMERLARILPSGNLGINCEASETSKGLRVAVASAEKGGFVLTIRGEPRLQLALDMSLIVSPKSGNIATLMSSFTVRRFKEARPLYTVDYVRGAQSNIPAAHYNFHFRHDEILQELLDTGRERRGRLYQKKVEDGKPAQLGDVHFPVGGHRFRPCLEDVIDHLWAEFGIDIKPEGKAAIRAGRQEWRSYQLRAAVADDPLSAIAELEKLGYRGTWGEGLSCPDLREERVHAL